MADYTIRDDYQAAFQEAIDAGRLSLDKDAPNYAGRYMYMCTGADGRDQFKNSLTRQYDV